MQLQLSCFDIFDFFQFIFIDDTYFSHPFPALFNRAGEAQRSLPNTKTRFALLLMRTGDMTLPNIREEVYIQLRAAADRWDIEAQYTLARLHAEGVVIRQSLPDAVFWLEVLRRNPVAKPYWSSRDAFIRAYRIGEIDRQTGLDMARIWLGTEPRIIPVVDYGKSIIEKDAVF